MRPLPVLALTGVVAAVCLWIEHLHERHQRPRPSTKKRRQAGRKPSSYHRGMTEQEYTALIPAPELQQVMALLRVIYDSRGWAAQPLMMHSAWQRVLDEVTGPMLDTPWTENAPMCSFQTERLAHLAGVLDSVFLAGQLQAWLASQGKKPVQFQVLTSAPGPDDWYANFFPQHNAVALRRSRWADEAMVITTQRPANYEGIHCTSRLQVLLHTMAHEMVHVLVYHRFPDVDAHCPAYTVDDRHGPIFRLLNAKLFGHTTEDFKRCFTR